MGPTWYLFSFSSRTTAYCGGLLAGLVAGRPPRRARAASWGGGRPNSLVELERMSSACSRCTIAVAADDEHLSVVPLDGVA
ncbi:unnamed protein product [Urochloa humidicola]